MAEILRSYAVCMRLLLSLAVALSLPAGALAQTAAAKKEPSPYDKAWTSFTELYVDDTNPVVQRVLLSGRFHYDFATIDSDQDDLSEWNVRRLRIGPRITFLKTFTFHSEVELDPKGLDPQRHDPFYVRLTDFYVMWTKNPQVVLTVGKQSAPFTLDGANSSRELLTIDRSNLANNIWFPQEYIPGVTLSGRRKTWVYRAGLYSSGAANRELGEFSGGTFVLGVLGYDFAPTLGVKEALLTGNYVYQNPDRDNTFTRQLEQIGSINFRFEDAKWGARADVSTAEGYLGQSGMWAFQGMPFVNITSKLQIVGRYTFIESDAPNGIRLATYESRVVSGRGDEYNELYVGANYYFYGHKLKLQTGLQVADMNDRANKGGEYSGVSWTTGLRVGW
jgi:phosphate-selective porin OprO and OprP